jgi:hypothetical protein
MGQIFLERPKKQNNKQNKTNKETKIKVTQRYDKKR